MWLFVLAEYAAVASGCGDYHTGLLWVCCAAGVANRDIKLDNVLLDKSVHGKPEWPIVKICDFGYAKHDAMSTATSRVVSFQKTNLTPDWLAGVITIRRLSQHSLQADKAHT